MCAVERVSKPMNSREPESTRSDLINAAKRLDADAWRELVDRYSWLVFHWCRIAGLAAEDAADVVQTVMVQVLSTSSTFKRTASRRRFRRWLRAITASKIADFRRTDGRQP